MKYCEKCGAEVQDDAQFCPKCGYKFGTAIKQEVVAKEHKRDDGIMTIALVFCIICTVAAGFAIIPLCWMIPMTVSLNDKIKNKEPISVAFKVCTLLFLSVIGGILLLVGDDND